MSQPIMVDLKQKLFLIVKKMLVPKIDIQKKDFWSAKIVGREIFLNEILDVPMYKRSK